MELIIIIAIISYVVKAIKKAEENQTKSSNSQAGTYQMPKQATRQTSPKVQLQQQTREEIQAQIARTKQRIMESRGMFEQMNLSDYEQKQSEPARRATENEHFQTADMHRQQENREAMQQVQKGRVEARNTTILQRALANTDEDKVDVTLETMEAEHNHSERVAPAVHHHPEDVIPESMLGTIEDLMVKGYDGHLCFERDFVGEGLDMISRFSYQ